MDVVLERDGDAVQRAADFAGGALAVALAGFLKRIRIDGNDGVQLVLVRGNADERLLDEVVRGDAPSRNAACISGMVASTTLNGLASGFFAASAKTEGILGEQTHRGIIDAWIAKLWKC